MGHVQALTRDLVSRAKIPDWVNKLLFSLPKDMHPMTQLNIAINALQTGSKFAKAYQQGVPKNKYWEYAYEDTLDIIAKLPNVCSAIYRHTYKDGKMIEPNVH